jgi:hypothetical protein
MSRIVQRIFATWMLASALVLCIVSWAQATIDIAPAATATANIMTQARDLGIIGGIVIAFMLILSGMTVGIAWLQDRATRRTAEALATMSFTSAQSIHNLMEHSSELSRKADERVERIMTFIQGRPCFMATDSMELLREASRTRRETEVAVAAQTVAVAAADAAATVIHTAEQLAKHNRRKDDAA